MEKNSANSIIKVDADTIKQYDKKVTSLDGVLHSIKSFTDFETLDFFAGNDTVRINPFALKDSFPNLATRYGVPYTKRLLTESNLCSLSSYHDVEVIKGIDGISSSKITSYDAALDKNGEPINRMPNLSNTLGLDIHHLKLPKNSIAQGADSVKMTFKSGASGATFLFLTYLAIETVQPNLKLELEEINQEIDLDENNEIQYKLKLYNVGLSTQEADKAFIVDSLDNAVVGIKDFTVYSSVTGIDAEILEGGMQINAETGRKFLKIQLKDSLPALVDTTDFVKPSDTLIVSFTAEIAGEDYPSWKLKCRRVVENFAYAYYGNDIHSIMQSRSNESKCDLTQDFAPVKINSEVFDIYDEDFELSADISMQQSVVSSKPMLSVLKQLLSDSIKARGIDDVNLDEYIFTDANGVVVSEDDYFNLDFPTQNFTATYISDRYNCEEVYHIKVLVANPKLDLKTDLVNVSCSGDKDGYINISLKDGAVTDEYKAYLYAGRYGVNVPVPDEVNPMKELGAIYSGGVENYVYLGKFDSLPVGVYTVVVRAVDNEMLSAQYENIEIGEPEGFSVEISSKTEVVCAGERSNAYLTIDNASTRSALSKWYSSVDGVNWSYVDSIKTTSLNAQLYEDTYFRAEVQIGKCKAVSAPALFKVYSTPIVWAPEIDSACYQYDLHNLPIQELGGVDEYDLSLHWLMPKSALDNSERIKEENLSVVVPTRIFSRMSVQNHCYTVDSTDIIIKEMDWCYPLEIPEFFSPDGDGINDLFQIKGIIEYNNPEIIVFDKSGVIVFRGTKEQLSPPNGWDGTYLGKPLPSADYWYMINFLEIKSKYGHFSLKRGLGY